MTSTPRKQDRAIIFLTQVETQRLFSAIKTKRDRVIFAVAGSKPLVRTIM